MSKPRKSPEKKVKELKSFDMTALYGGPEKVEARNERFFARAQCANVRQIISGYIHDLAVAERKLEKISNALGQTSCMSACSELSVAELFGGT